MTISINGKTYTEQELLAALQKHFGVGDLQGNITHIFRECYRWQHEKKGIPYTWKTIERDYKCFADPDTEGELPECTWHYYAEVVDPARPTDSKEAAE